MKPCTTILISEVMHIIGRGGAEGGRKPEEHQPDSWMVQTNLGWLAALVKALGSG